MSYIAWQCALEDLNQDQPAYTRSMIRSFDVRLKKPLDAWLSTKRPVRTLIRLCGCTAWSESSLGAHARRYIIWHCVLITLNTIMRPITTIIHQTISKSHSNKRAPFFFFFADLTEQLLYADLTNPYRATQNRSRQFPHHENMPIQFRPP